MDNISTDEEKEEDKDEEIKSEDLNEILRKKWIILIIKTIIWKNEIKIW